MARAEIKSGKAVSVFFEEEKPYQRWGNDHFTSERALSSNGISNSGFIAAALRWKVEQFTQASWAVVRIERKAGGRSVENVVEDHPMMELLRYPCGTARGSMTRTEFLTRMVCSYELEGVAYARRLRHAGGYTNRLQFMPKAQVRAVRVSGSEKPVDYYEYTWAGGTIKLDPSQIIVWQQGVDLKNPNDGWSPLKSVLAERLTEKQISAYNNYIMGNLSVGNKLITPETMDDAVDFDQDMAKKVKELLDERRGAGVGGDTVFPIPLKVMELHATPDKMAIQHANLIPLTKIMAVMNVDPSVIPAFMAYYSDSKGADAKAKNEVAFKSSILPMGQSWGERQTLDVLSDFGDIRTERVIMDTRNVWQVQEDLNKLHERTQKDFLSNIISQNQALAVYGLDPREGGDRTHAEFPQLINGQHDDTILNGTNGKLANEQDRSSRPNLDDGTKAWRRLRVLGSAEREKRAEAVSDDGEGTGS